MLKRPASANPHQEVRQVLQGRTEPSVDDVPKLQFVEQCFREALRLYSPVTFITRDVAHDTLLGGHRVYQGERINLVTRALHTNPEYWAGAAGEFGDPLSFNPDRFSPEAVRERHPNAYHPWGFASRACIGSQFALFEAKTFLASMLIHFRLQGIPGYKIVASCEGGGAAPSPENLAFHVFPRPGGPLWSDGIMRPLAMNEGKEDENDNWDLWIWVHGIAWVNEHVISGSSFRLGQFFLLYRSGVDPIDSIDHRNPSNLCTDAGCGSLAAMEAPVTPLDWPRIDGCPRMFQAVLEKASAQADLIDVVLPPLRWGT